MTLPSVYTIDPHLPFVDVLAEGIVARIGDEPLALASCLVLLPTRRAGRALREAFLRRSGGKATLLPRMIPLGDIDEEELELSAAAADLPGTADIPPAIAPLRRQMLLTRLILAGRGGAGTAPPSPAHAALLAKELGRFLDQTRTEGLSFDTLDTLVPNDIADHWQKVLEFLKILTHHWPAILADNGGLDHAERRNRVLAAQAAAWQAQPPATPIIAAGSTGSIPATATLLKVISRLPQGFVVLPGLDRGLDGESWDVLEETHPQYGLKHLLTALEIDRDAVADWTAKEPGPRHHHADRVRLIREALRPAQTTQAWQKAKPFDHHALNGVEMMNCPSPREEALAIALMMRGELEQDGHTAALVTPDRDLARRVAGELTRWGLEVDDSAGQPLSLTPPGAFLRLTTQMVREAFAPVPLLAALKHPLAAGGRDVGEFRVLVRALETDALRGPRPAPGLDALRRVSGGAMLINDLERLADPFIALMQKKTAPFADLLAAHMEFAEGLAATDGLPGPARLWAGEAGARTAELVAEVHGHADLLEPIAPDAYPALLEAFLSSGVARPPQGGHPRLSIWGPLEARLQHADLIILGGLNEGTWPGQTAPDPWMSRPMRRDFGLPQPERRIGLSAHDFAQAFCAPRVALTRAERVEGTPTVRSRWLMRLQTVLRATENADTGVWRDTSWRDWAGLLDQTERERSPGPPEPRPPLSARPQELSVTQVETWMRDPYAIYAAHILKLKALDPLDADPGLADYGTLVHKALEVFCRTFPASRPLPDDALHRLSEIGKDLFAPLMDRPGVQAFWQPRFARIAAWFVMTENSRRANIAETFTEIKGRHSVDGFTVTAKADRIDRMTDGSLTIIDYKTGSVPSKKEVTAGFSPQLPLEAVIAEAGGFPDVGKRPVSQLLFWQLKGDETGGKEISAGEDPKALAAAALAGLANLVKTFADERTPYAARPHPEMAPKYSDYQHLARVKEWASEGEGQDDA